MIGSVEMARRVRENALRMVARANSSHIGGSLSCADILSVLYSDVLVVDPKDPFAKDRDRLLVSKGHAAPAVYSVLAEAGFFSIEQLESYCCDGSIFMGHVDHQVPGVEVSSGSLGHGLSISCGLALAAKVDNVSRRTFVLLSDGELNEGSCWEAIQFAGHFRLSSLTAIVDANGLQGLDTVDQVMNLNPLKVKFESFGWEAVEVDGHDHSALATALRAVPGQRTGPYALIARTVKGKGISFMENSLQWHYKSPNTEQLAAALREIGEK